MSRNWIRSCTLTLSGQKQRTITGGGDTDLRIVFRVEQWSGQTTNTGRFRIYNPSQSLATALQAKEFTAITFEAGYRNNIGVIFKGEIRQFIGGHESAVDTYIDIFAADGERMYNKATVNKTLAAGYTPKDKLDVAIQAMAPFGGRLGLTNVDLSQPKFPRGLPMIGMARDVIREIAFAAGATWSIQRNEVRLIDYRRPIQGGDIEMNGRTGMVGWPKQTPDGILVTSFLNPKLQPHVNLKINPASIIQAERDNNTITGPGSAGNFWLDQQNIAGGTYNIYRIDRHGDTRAAEWFDESTCIGAGGLLPPQAMAQKYYLGTS